MDYNEVLLGHSLSPEHEASKPARSVNIRFTWWFFSEISLQLLDSCCEIWLPCSNGWLLMILWPFFYSTTVMSVFSRIQWNICKSKADGSAQYFLRTFTAPREWIPLTSAPPGSCGFESRHLNNYCTDCREICSTHSPVSFSRHHLNWSNNLVINQIIGSLLHLLFKFNPGYVVWTADEEAS